MCSKGIRSVVALLTFSKALGLVKSKACAESLQVVVPVAVELQYEDSHLEGDGRQVTKRAKSVESVVTLQHIATLHHSEQANYSINSRLAAFDFGQLVARA